MLSLGTVEGKNNKAKVVIRKSYGFKTPEMLKMALYHELWEAFSAKDYPQILQTNP